MNLEDEANQSTEILRGKTVERIVRHREGEILIKFVDGSRLFANSDTPLELSIELSD